ncbi:MAG: hypothetical protein IKK39_14285 [Thermoguttaceae bacterium]|nr:hypothetical protein [Thermoguttaceae bacterium]MBR4105212.1 hypothetical protein [Thermoguttaceae bacterium]
MKFFFRVVTKTTVAANVVANRARFRGALIVALAGLACVGCVGRKQYAINEAILISERRQLEDEIYRLQFELRDALEENERLRQELGGDEAENANVPTSRTRTRGRAGANDAFFPGLDAAQAPLRTTGGLRQVQTTSTTAPQNADAAPATGEAVETLPDYVPIPVTSTRSGAARTRTANGVRTAQNVGVGAKTLGVRRELNGGRVAPVAASTAPEANGGNVVSSVFVDSPSSKESATNGAAWSPLAQ